ncbi:MAG TPA: HAD family phosphatase [Anaerolineae bacterium]|nr:HAD family phosphatase [Anaerolineae bacterium]
MTIEAVIFDMDGLLVDSEPVWDKARSSMAAEAGKEWNKEDHKAVMGVSTDEWVTYMIQRLELTISPQEVQDEIVQRMLAMYRERVPYLPGAIQAVTLAAEHYPTALASGSHRSLIDAVTNDPQMQGKFRVILSSDEVGVGKPAPDVYLQTARRLGFSPESCLCLEDSGNGILAGVRAGMKVVAVPDPRFSPKQEILDQAHLVLNSLTAFSLETIKQLGAG